MSVTASIWKSRVRPFLPPLFRRIPRALWGWKWFRGRYGSWAEAAAAAGSYEAPAILERVLAATLEVQAGRAAYERDAVLFHDSTPEAELLECLRHIAVAEGNRLRVLDFGGALGSAYWRHRPWLDGLATLRWDVVEQPHFVQAGKENIRDNRLAFFPTIAEAERAVRHEVLLAATVVNYLPDPWAAVADFQRSGVPWLLFHNLALHDGEPDYLMVEHVPPEMYPASYPMWFLNRAKFLEQFAGRYTLERAYASTAVWDRGWFDYPGSGLLFRRISPS